MAQIAAKSVQICIFWKTGLNYNDVETSWPADVRAAWNALGNAIVKLRQRHGSGLPVEMYVCPIDLPENAVIIANNGLDPSLLPAVQVWAEYPDGTGSSYFLSKKLSERFTGINWTTSEVQPYIEALLYRSKPSDVPLICKIVPPLCNVGGWVWLALAIGATAKASSAKGVGRAAWGTGAALLWQGWYKRGGLEQIKQAAGIGKYYDDVTIKPGSRVDEFWKGMAPNPKWCGVADMKGKQFTIVPDAIKHFGLYSIEFGNWLNQAYRLNFMYATMVTMRDMAEVVGVRQDKMGFRKKLSLAFGSRGKGGFAAAFYQPSYTVINLTKTNGRGTFCHEYGHAVDHELNWPSGARSTRWQPNYVGKKKGSAAYLMEYVLDRVLWTDSGNPSTYQNFLIKENSEYLARRTEIWARIVERFFLIEFEAKGIFNTWGVRNGRDLPNANLIEPLKKEIRQIFKLAIK